MKLKLKQFSLLWAIGMVGVLTLLWIDLPLPPEPLPVPLPALKLLILLQPTLILSVAVAIGVALASQVKLSAPFLEVIALPDQNISSKSQLQYILYPQLPPAALGGLFSAILVLIGFALFQSSLPPDFVSATGTFKPPIFTRIFWGGISEELIMRWGLMTFLVWLPWRILDKGKGSPRPLYYILALSLAALLFGVLHLPIASLLSSEITMALVAYIIFANSIVGAIAGYLYWKFGLESAIIAHALFHVIVVIFQG